MKTDELRVTNDGLALIRDMLSAKERLRRAESERNSASCEVSNAESALFKWLLPKDAKVGDVFCLPVRDTFLEVHIEGQVSYSENGGEHITPKPVARWRGGVQPRERL